MNHNKVLLLNGGHLGSVILNVLILKPAKTTKIDQEVIEINHSYVRQSYDFSLKRWEIKILKKMCH